MGCELLNCKGYKNDPHYKNAEFNKEYIAENSNNYAKGLSYDQSGVTHDQLVINNIIENPVSTGIAAGAMVAAGASIGAGAALSSRIIAGGAGAAVNASTQIMVGQLIDWQEVGISAGAAFITGSSTNWVQGISGASLVNSGAVLLDSNIKNENPSPLMAGAAVGSVLGYAGGKMIQTPLDNYFNPWHRDSWTVGPLGILTSKPPSNIPGIAAAIGSSGIQELSGTAATDQIKKSKKN